MYIALYVKFFLYMLPNKTCVEDLVRLGLSGVRVAGWSLQACNTDTTPAAPNLQHTTNREQNDRCGNSTAQSQAPDDGYINVRNMLST